MDLDLNVGTLLIIMVVCLILYSYIKCDCSELEKYQNIYIEPFQNNYEYFIMNNYNDEYLE